MMTNFGLDYKTKQKDNYFLKLMFPFLTHLRCHAILIACSGNQDVDQVIGASISISFQNVQNKIME